MKTHSPDLGDELDSCLSAAPTVTWSGSGNAAAHGVADWLSFAAAPTFALMALLTVVGGRGDMLCSVENILSPLPGMAAMYLLMSVFHTAPWLKLVFAARRGNS